MSPSLIADCDSFLARNLRSRNWKVIGESRACVQIQEERACAGARVAADLRKAKLELTPRGTHGEHLAPEWNVGVSPWRGCGCRQAYPHRQV